VEIDFQAMMIWFIAAILILVRKKEKKLIIVSPPTNDDPADCRKISCMNWKSILLKRLSKKLFNPSREDGLR
jgi:hypothetical protein